MERDGESDPSRAHTRTHTTHNTHIHTHHTQTHTQKKHTSTRKIRTSKKMRCNHNIIVTRHIVIDTKPSLWRDLTDPLPSFFPPYKVVVLTADVFQLFIKKKKKFKLGGVQKARSVRSFAAQLNLTNNPDRSSLVQLYFS